MPWWLLTRVAGLAWPAMREFGELRYQWDRPFIVDSSRFTETFGDTAAEMPHAIAETVRWWRRTPGAVTAA